MGLVFAQLQHNTLKFLYLFFNAYTFIEFNSACANHGKLMKII